MLQIPQESESKGESNHWLRQCCVHLPNPGHQLVDESAVVLWSVSIIKMVSFWNGAEKLINYLPTSNYLDSHMPYLSGGVMWPGQKACAGSVEFYRVDGISVCCHLPAEGACNRAMRVWEIREELIVNISHDKDTIHVTVLIAFLPTQAWTNFW